MSATSADPTRGWVRAAAVVAAFVALLWVVEIVDAVDGGDLDRYGIEPRSEDGLVGIAVAPLLHSGWTHLEANSVPLLVLGLIVAVVSTARFFGVLAWTWVVERLRRVAGRAEQLGDGRRVRPGLRAARPTCSWSASSSVGAVGILVGVGVFLLYGGVLLGVLPGQPGVSWQGHLFGAVGGVLAAYHLANRRRPRDWCRQRRGINLAGSVLETVDGHHRSREH